MPRTCAAFVGAVSDHANCHLLDRHDLERPGVAGLLFNAIGVGSLLLFARTLVSAGAHGIALALLYSGAIQVGLQTIYYYSVRRRDAGGERASI